MNETLTDAVMTEPVTNYRAPNGRYITQNDYDYLTKTQGLTEGEALSVLFASDKYKAVEPTTPTEDTIQPVTKTDIQVLPYDEDNDYSDIVLDDGEGE